MNIVLSAPANDAIILFSILMFPSLELPPVTSKSPSTNTLAVANLTFAPANLNSFNPFSSYSIVESAASVPFAPPPVSYTHLRAHET